MRWKHRTNMSEIYVVHAQVDWFSACQLEDHAYVTEMYDLLSQIRKGALQAGADLGWDVLIRYKLGELY